jgi:hypothetical protein
MRHDQRQLITLEIYNAKSHAAKFVPVIFGSKDREFIPEPLSDHVYCLDSKPDSKNLPRTGYRF